MTPTTVTPLASAFLAGWAIGTLIVLLTSLACIARKGAPAPVERPEALPGALPPYRAPGGGPHRTTSVLVEPTGYKTHCGPASEFRQSRNPLTEGQS